MKAAYGISVAVLAALISGCAGTQDQTRVDQLTSSIASLEQRVESLEYASYASTPSTVTQSVPVTGSISTSTVSVSASSSTSEQRSMKDIQQALKNAGFYQGRMDGKKGPMTREAIKEFQRVHGLKDDGVVGSQTWAQLAPYLSGDASDMVLK